METRIRSGKLKNPINFLPPVILTVIWIAFSLLYSIGGANSPFLLSRLRNRFGTRRAILSEMRAQALKTE